MQKFLRTLMLAALMLPFASQAQETLTVFDGTNTNNYVPFNGNYADYGTRGQFIYPASELTNMVGATITQLTFYAQQATLTYGQQFTVYMKEVENTTFASASLEAMEDWSSMEVVYVGTVGVTDNQMVISLSSPYTYNGGHLMVGFQVTDWSSVYASSTWIGLNQPSGTYTGIYNNANSSHVWNTYVSRVTFLPKTTFTYQAGEVTCATVRGLTAVDSLTTSTSVTLNWRDTINEGASYSILRTAGNDTAWVAVPAGDTTFYSYTFNGLTNNTTYNFAVRAICSATDSSMVANRSVRTLSTADTITTFTASGTTKRGDLVFDTVNHTITVPVWYTNSLSNLTLSWNLAAGAAAFVDTTGDGSYTCQVTNYTVKNYLCMNTPLTLRIKAEERTAYADYTLLLQSEDCVKDRNFALTPERIRYTATWDNPDTLVTTHYFIHSATRLSAEELATAEYITVTGAHQYTVEGLERGTQYYAYEKAACDSVWAEDSVTTLNLATNATVIVAEGTATTDYVPVYGYNYDNTQRSQSIYPASMLTELVGKTITGVQYQISGSNNPSGWYTGNYTEVVLNVNLAITEQENLSSAWDATEVTNVYTGQMAADGTIVFDQPFTYNGGNLLVNFEMPNRAAWKRVYFYGVSSTGGSRYAYGSSYATASGTVANFLPMMAVAYSVTPNACPDVTAFGLDSLSHDFAAITWTASDADYCVGNQIIVSPTVLDEAGLAAATPVALAATAHSYNATGLTADHDYYVYVKALCNGSVHPEGTSGWAAYEFHTYPTVRTPEIVSVDFTGKHKATLDVANTGANVGQPVNYDYIASTTLLDAAALAAATPTATGIDTMIFDVENLASATQYFFYVRNVMGTDVSPWSAPDSVTMPVAMPKPLYLQTSNIAHNALTALWLRDDANYADETAWRAAIVLHGQQPAAADWVTTTNMEESSYVLGYHLFLNLTADTAYDIYVAAFDAATGATSDTVVLDSVRTAKFPGNGIIVANGTATNAYAPVYGNYVDDPQRSQSIYPASMLTALVGKNITDMRYYANGSSFTNGENKWANKPFTVSLKVTEQANLGSAWADTTDATIVYTGDLAVDEDGMMLVTFNEPFTYNGGNLLVSFNMPKDSSGYKNVYFYGMAVDSASRTAYGTTVNSGTAAGTVQNFLPKVMFDYEGATNCLPVTRLYAMDLTYEGVNMMWYPGNEETAWQYVVSTSDSLTAAELEAAAQPLQTSNVSLSGLLSDTAYTFYIRPVCSATENGPWNSFDFETEYIDFFDVTVIVNDETMGTAAGMTHILTGTDTMIVAEANAGFEFYKWTVNGEDVFADTLGISVDSNMTVYAYFKYAEATIAASAVTYWVGNGSNQAVLAINWADTALAWGVNFSTETITVQDAMDSIAAADPRFSYTLSYGYLDDILFVENGDTLSKVMDSYWESKNNGISDQGMFQPLANGDFEKWAEPAAGFLYDSMFYEYEYMGETYTYTSYLYAYPMAINAVTAPVFYNVTVSYNELMGEVTGAPEAPVFAGTEITLTAEAYDYAHFVNWTYGDAIDTNETLVVTVNSDMDIHANFAYNPVHVTYAVNDTTMGSVTPSGVQTYEVGAVMVVTATANEGYHFAGWRMQIDDVDTTVTDLGATLTDTVTPFHDGIILTALFEANAPVEVYYNVTVLSANNNMGTVTSTASGQVLENTNVTVTATANSGYHFVAWVNANDDTVARTNVYTFTVTADVTLMAVFAENAPEDVYYNVTVLSANNNMGTVASTASGQVLENTNVTVTATANSGYHFVAWVNANDDTVARTNVYTFTVTADVTLMAVFAENNPDVNYYTVTVTYDQSRGRVEGAAEYEEGSTVSLVAYPFEHYEFVAWLDENNDTLSTNTAYTIVNLQSNRSLTAVFQPKTGIEDVEGVSAKVFSVDNRIVVKGAENLNVYVYDVNGRAVCRQANAAETVEFTMSNSGVYLVKVGNAPAKRVVVVR